MVSPACFDFLKPFTNIHVDAMGNKIESTKKKAKLSASELRKKRKDRMQRRKNGEEIFSDEE